jgi:two-component system cell cycle sensor histidine kinase/response regulator CckA
MDELPANRLRIMIVENDRVTARDLEATLRRRGFVVTGIAYSAHQALDLLQEDKPDLVLLDIQLDEDGGDGIDLACQLREAHGIPSIFITGYSEESILERAKRADPAAFIRKPFSDSELVVCLESVVEQRIAGERLSLRLPGLEAVSHQLPQAVIASDLAGRVVYLNPSAVSLTGWSASDAVGSALGQVIPLEENGITSDGTGEAGAVREVTLRTKSGETVAVEERSVPIRATDGEAVGLVSVLASVISQDPPAPEPRAPQPEAAPDPEAPTTTLPPARSEALRKIASLANDPAFKDLLAKKKEKPVATPDANPVVLPAAVLTAASPAAQSVLPASAFAQIEEVGDPLLKIDEDGMIRYANREALQVFAPGQRLVGTAFRHHFNLDDSERYEDHFNRPLADGRRHRFDFHDSNRGMWFEVRAYPTEGGVLALFTDITATRLEAAEQVRQQRLEGLGLLARGFAHDFNNYLTTLTGNISLAREKHPDDSEMQSMLEEAQTAASRATGLVQQLMTFARGGRPIRERTRVSDLIRRILTEHRIQHPEIRYQFQGTDAEVIANVDPAQIGRLIENLISNSAAAMQDGGVLILRSSRIQPEDVLKIRSSHTPSDEDHLLIEIIDTGHGMSDHDLERVFEPYFTTKKANNATGIGLTVCESIAKAHGGFIQLQSKEGKGTIATFCAPIGRRPDDTTELDGFPAYPNFDIPNLTAAPPRAPGEDSLLVGTRILILEDDAPIRRLMAATLRRAGHEVVETKEGRETIAVYTDAMERGERFHLLICDLTIENGVGGVETMRRLLQIDPNVLSIVSSGYSDAPAMSSPAAFGFKGVLPKPYAPTELRAAVHRILTAHHIIP